MKKALVFLGYRLAYDYDNWVDGYKNGIYNDNGPYGYKNFKSNEIMVDYFRLNKLEKKILFNKYLQYIYVYFIKLPILLLKYDIVWTHYDKDGLFISKLRCFPLFKRFSAKQIANFVWLIDDSKDYNNKKIDKISMYLKNIEKIIFHSNTEKEKFIKIFNIDSKNLKHVLFGINFEAYSTLKPMQKPKNLNYDSDYILFVGTDKHRDIQSFKLIAERYNKERFVFITNNERFKNERYPNNVNVLSANLPEVRWLYNNCKFVILPLKYNEHVSGCTTILEVAAFKKAVIVTDTPGINDYVNENTGILVKNNDEFFIAVERLLNDKNLCKILGENAYKFCVDKFTTYNWSKEHVELTKEILEKSKVSW